MNSHLRTLFIIEASCSLAIQVSPRFKREFSVFIAPTLPILLNHWKESNFILPQKISRFFWRASLSIKNDKFMHQQKFHFAPTVTLKSAYRKNDVFSRTKNAQIGEIKCLAQSLNSPVYKMKAKRVTKQNFKLQENAMTWWITNATKWVEKREAIQSNRKKRNTRKKKATSKKFINYV